MLRLSKDLGRTDAVLSARTSAAEGTLLEGFFFSFFANSSTSSKEGCQSCGFIQELAARVCDFLSLPAHPPLALDPSFLGPRFLESLNSGGVRGQDPRKRELPLQMAQINAIGT